MAVVVVLVVIGVVIAGVVTWSTASEHARLGPGERRFPQAGISLRAPDGWVEKAGSPSWPASLLELEQRGAFGNIATAGLWVSRWSAGGQGTAEHLAQFRAEPDALATSDVTVDGRAAVRRVERIGPAVVNRLPGSVTLQRTQYRLEAFGQVFEIGFWGGGWVDDDAIERDVIASVRFSPPAPVRITEDDFELTVPGGWNDGAEYCGKVRICWFSPAVAPNTASDGWIYVFDAKGASLDEVAGDLLQKLGQNERVSDVSHESAQLDGQPAVRLRFGFRQPDAGPDFPTNQNEEYLVHTRKDRYLVLALGWRSADGRAALDRLVESLELPLSSAP